MGRELYFFPSNTDALSCAPHSIFSDESRGVILVGRNDLADRIAAAFSRRNRDFTKRESVLDISRDCSCAVVLTETCGKALSEQLHAFIDHQDIVLLAPETDWHFSRKPLFIISIPKSGTHLLYQLAEALGYRPGVELPEFPLGMHWYCVEYSNSHTVARDFFVDSVRRSHFGNRHHSFMRSPALFMYRHPLDILVSEANYYHQDGKTAYSGWLASKNFLGRIKCLAETNHLLGPLKNRLEGFLPWLEFPNVVSLSFEELVGSAGGGDDLQQNALVWSIQLKLQAPGNTEAITKTIFNRKSATFRSGQIGSFLQCLAPETIAEIGATIAAPLDEFGYSLDRATLPTKAEARRTQRVRYSEADFDQMPLTLEGDFIGCNLVRYSGRIYAIPQSAGPVALEALPGEILAALPSGKSLAEIKSLLLMGSRQLDNRKQELAKLADIIKARTATEEIACGWQETTRPILAGEYEGFNIVVYGGRYFGIRQTLGTIDFTQELRTLVESLPPSDFHIANSLPDLYDHIDGISRSERLVGDVSALRLRVEKENAELRQCVSDAREKISAALVEIATANTAIFAISRKSDAEFAAIRNEIRAIELMLNELQKGWLTRAVDAVKHMFRRIRR